MLKGKNTTGSGGLCTTFDQCMVHADPGQTLAASLNILKKQGCEGRGWGSLSGTSETAHYWGKDFTELFSQVTKQIHDQANEQPQ